MKLYRSQLDSIFMIQHRTETVPTLKLESPCLECYALEGLVDSLVPAKLRLNAGAFSGGSLISVHIETNSRY